MKHLSVMHVGAFHIPPNPHKCSRNVVFLLRSSMLEDLLGGEATCLWAQSWKVTQWASVPVSLAPPTEVSCGGNRAPPWGTCAKGPRLLGSLHMFTIQAARTVPDLREINCLFCQQKGILRAVTLTQGIHGDVLLVLGRRTQVLRL